MADLGGIKMSSGMELNSSRPLDLKQRMSTANRLDLTFVQRWIGMTTYDTDLNVWKVLIANPVGDTTVESNWDDFGGGFDGTGIYVADVLVGDSQGDVIITHGLNTRDLHISCFTLPFYTMTTLDVTESSLNAITVRGYGADQTVHVVIGTGGTSIAPGENPAVALAVTYAEAETLISTNDLDAGLYYKITDYATVVDMGSEIQFGSYIGSIHTGAVEALILRALTDSTFDIRAFSEIHPDDDIDYDFNDNKITVEEEGYIEDGVDDGEAITLSVIDATTLQANKTLTVNDSFEMELEDDNFYYYFEAADEGTGFELIDNGNGTTNIHILQPIDFIGSSSWWLWIFSGVVVQPRNGFITRRKNRTNNIETWIDFRENTRLRFRVDLSDLSRYPTYNALTSYNQRDLVQYNGDIYFYLAHKSITNQTPNSGSRYWSLSVKNANNSYIFSNNRNGGIDHTLDLVPKEMPMLGTYDSLTQTTTRNIKGMTDILLKSDDIVILPRDANSEHFKGVTMETGCYGITLIGNYVRDLHLLSGTSELGIGIDSSVVGNFSKMKLRRTMIVLSLHYCEISYLYNCTLSSASYSNIGYNTTNSYINNLYYSEIGKACNNLFIGYSYYLDIGGSSNNIYMYYAYRVKLGYGCYRVYNYSSQFRNSTWGSETRRLHFENTAWIEQFNVLNRMGPTSGERVISCDIRDTQAGNEFLTYGDLNVGTYVRFSKFGDNCRGFNVSGMIYYSSFGSNCQDISTTSGHINNSSFGNTVYSITAGSLQNCTFQNNIGLVNVSGNVTGCVIDSSTGSITNAGEFASCSFGQSVSGINFQTTGVTRYLNVEQRCQGVIIPATATWVTGFYNKDLFMREGGDKRYRYVDATDVVVYGDPSV